MAQTRRMGMQNGRRSYRMRRGFRTYHYGDGRRIAAPPTPCLRPIDGYRTSAGDTQTTPIPDPTPESSLPASVPLRLT
jgi:hypothetical protein